MRGDAALTARLLLRGPGLAGTTIAIAGVLGVVSTVQAWRHEVERVELLGGSGERTLSTVRGVPEQPLAWLVLVAAVVLLWIGLALALDRPPMRARLAAGVAALILILTGAIAMSGHGPGSAPPDGGEATRASAVAFPVGVEVTTVHRTGPGPWLALAGGILALAGTLAARER